MESCLFFYKYISIRKNELLEGLKKTWGWLVYSVLTRFPSFLPTIITGVVDIFNYKFNFGVYKVKLSV